MTPQQAIDAARAAGDAAKSRDPMTGSIVDAVVADIVARLEALEPRRHFGRTRWEDPGESIADAVRALPVVPATCGECHGLSSVGRLYGWCRALDQGVALRLSPPADCPLRKGDA